MDFKMSSVKWQPFYLGLIVLNHDYHYFIFWFDLSIQINAILVIMHKLDHNPCFSDVFLDTQSLRQIAVILLTTFSKQFKIL